MVNYSEVFNKYYDESNVECSAIDMDRNVADITGMLSICKIDAAKLMQMYVAYHEGVDREGAGVAVYRVDDGDVGFWSIDHDELRLSHDQIEFVECMARDKTWERFGVFIRRDVHSGMFFDTYICEGSIAPHDL